MTALFDDPSLRPQRSCRPAALARLRHRLLARIHRQYATATREVRVGPLELTFTRIADPDRVLDEVAAEEDRRERLSGRREQEPLHLPYWAELWDSAAGVGKWLAKAWGVGGGEWGVGSGELMSRPRLLTPHALLPTPHSSPPTVLDLGCGMGLSGTVAAALGARVLFADLEPPALLFARLNSLPFDRPKPAGPAVRTRRLNWRTDRLGERFDLIVGADILYERHQWEHLEPFWRAHLAPAGAVLLGEPRRPTGDVFGDWIRARGWAVEVFEEPVDTRPKPIRLFRLTDNSEFRSGGRM